MAARGRQAISGGSIRSGRFSLKNNSAIEKEFIVIDSSSSSVYRFFNTGSDTFEVKSLTTTKRIPVNSKCSIDVNVSKKIVIVVPANSAIEGIYDYAESHSGIRSGRFVGNLVQGSYQTMIFGRKGSLYRFFNSGDHPLFIKNGQSPLVKIPVRHSLDLIVQKVVKIGTNSATPVKIESIYEYLDSEKPVRSGRFKRAVSDAPANFHQIIDFRSYVNPPIGKKVPYALYRIFNSGKNPIKIVAREGGSADTTLRTLEIEQSMDIGFNATGFDLNKSIWVQSTANDKPIEGIYEFLGFDAD